MTPSETVRRRIGELGDWFQNMELEGVPTAPNHFLGDYPRAKWRTFQHAIPTDLTGKTVLDIGCNAGFYSIEMKKRGADRVVAMDADPHYLAQARFAAQVQQIPIEFVELDVYSIASLQERFDVVIFMGVLYHLRHPLLALDLIHDHVAKDTLVFQSLTRGSTKIAAIQEDYPFEETDVFEQEGYPVMHFVEHRFAHDPTNWWIPNRACVQALLRASGFQIRSNPAEDVYICGLQGGRRG